MENENELSSPDPVGGASSGFAGLVAGLDPHEMLHVFVVSDPEEREEIRKLVRRAIEHFTGHWSASEKKVIGQYFGVHPLDAPDGID